MYSQVTGMVLSKKDQTGLTGVTIQLKSDIAVGSTTDEHGKFSIKAYQGDTIVISYVGYESREITITNELVPMNILLSEQSTEIDEIIVTGVFDPRRRIESSIAITTLGNEELQIIVPNSAQEILRQVPGVFVQSARGEISNQIFTRGMIFDGNQYLVSLQEDGLPIMSSQSLLRPDGFIRLDDNIKRVEALRGGTASILGVNAPGGIFNYISNTGSDVQEGFVTARLGLEGNGKNPYSKISFNAGGPLVNNNKWTYNIGASYRYADGPKYPGYPLSQGGQLKGNVVKSFSTGSFKLSIKWLDDHTKDFEFTPSTDFNNPRPAGHFTNSSSVLIDGIKVKIPSNGDGVRSHDYDSKKVNHFKEKSFTLNWEQRLGDDSWKMTHAFKYSGKSSLDQGTFIVYPNEVTGFLYNAIFGFFGNPGKYKYYNLKTNQVYGTVTHDFTIPGFFSFEGNLPGADVIKNGVFFTPLTVNDTRINDVFYQGTLTKVFGKMKMTLGAFSNRSHQNNYRAYGGAGTAFSTIEDKPQAIGIEYTPAFGGLVQQITDPQGVSGYNQGPDYGKQNVITSWSNSIYFNHQWQLTRWVNLDWGARYENMSLSNTYRVSNQNQTSSTGGPDRNVNTVYDNYTGSLTTPVTVKKMNDNFSYSAGINILKSKRLAYYARFSKGAKAPTTDLYIQNQKIGDKSQEFALSTIQIEGGVKYIAPKTTLTVTPFYSSLINIPQAQWDVDKTGPDATTYNLPVLYNKFHAIGIEVEGNTEISKNVFCRANAVFQRFYNDRYQYWDPRNPGPADDTIIDLSHKKISFFAAPFIYNITPYYQDKKMYAGINIYGVSRRPANANEAWYLPAYQQLDINIGYNISKRIKAKLSINNILNTFGLVDWTGAITDGIFFSTFTNQAGLTKEQVKANPNLIYYSLGIQPRAYFLDFTYTF